MLSQVQIFRHGGVGGLESKNRFAHQDREGSGNKSR